MKAKKSNTKKAKAVDKLPINKVFKKIDQVNAEYEKIQREKEAEEDAELDKQLIEIEEMQRHQKEKTLLAKAQGFGFSMKDRMAFADEALKLARVESRVNSWIVLRGEFYTVGLVTYYRSKKDRNPLHAEGLSRRSEKDHKNGMGDAIAIGRAKKSMLIKLVTGKQTHDIFMA